MQNQNKQSLAVVTGASSGIGYELAKVFAKNGYNLLVAAEDAGIIEAAQSFRSLGVEVEALQADLAKLEGVDDLVNQIAQSRFGLEIVAINAGVGVSGEFLQTAWDKELNLVQLNIISAAYLTKKILPRFVTQGHGRILFTSSIAATMPGPYYAMYAASKAFIQSFAEAIRFEVKDKNITVTALQPGTTDTHFFERAEMMDTKAGVAEKDDPAQVAQQGFDALMRGDDHVVAGAFKNQVQAKMANFMTQPQGAKAHAAQTKPGSAGSGSSSNQRP